MGAANTRRIAERISKIVAEMLERRIKDPRLGFVTVTEVREGFECGIGIGYNDIKIEDVIETFEMREKPRS